MAWEEAVIELRASDCPFAATMRRGQRIQCSRPGDGTGMAVVEGDVPGWEPVDGEGTCRPTAPCAGCPAAGLPADVTVRMADVQSGKVTLHAWGRDRMALRQAYEHLRPQQARIKRIGRPAPATRSRWVDLGALSPRQWEALVKAGSNGYFADGHGRRQNVEALADAMGCGRSAAHEHLRKALAAVVASIADGPENQR